MRTLKCHEEDYLEENNTYTSAVRCEAQEFCRYTIDNHINLNRSCAEDGILTIFEENDLLKDGCIKVNTDQDTHLEMHCLCSVDNCNYACNEKDCEIIMGKNLERCAAVCFEGGVEENRIRNISTCLQMHSVLIFIGYLVINFR